MVGGRWSVVSGQWSVVVDRIQSKAARLRRIEHRLYNTPQGLRAVELAEYCGVDRRTVYRDLASLELLVPDADVPDSTLKIAVARVG